MDHTLSKSGSGSSNGHAQEVDLTDPPQLPPTNERPRPPELSTVSTTGTPVTWCQNDSSTAGTVHLPSASDLPTGQPHQEMLKMASLRTPPHASQALTQMTLLSRWSGAGLLGASSATRGGKPSSTAIECALADPNQSSPPSAVQLQASRRLRASDSFFQASESKDTPSRNPGFTGDAGQLQRLGDETPARVPSLDMIQETPPVISTGLYPLDTPAYQQLRAPVLHPQAQNSDTLPDFSCSSISTPSTFWSLPISVRTNTALMFAEDVVESKQLESRNEPHPMSIVQNAANRMDPEEIRDYFLRLVKEAKSSQEEGVPSEEIASITLSKLTSPYSGIGSPSNWPSALSVSDLARIPFPHPTLEVPAMAQLMAELDRLAIVAKTVHAILALWNEASTYRANHAQDGRLTSSTTDAKEEWEFLIAEDWHSQTQHLERLYRSAATAFCAEIAAPVQATSPSLLGKIRKLDTSPGVTVPSGSTQIYAQAQQTLRILYATYRERGILVIPAFDKPRFINSLSSRDLAHLVRLCDATVRLLRQGSEFCHKSLSETQMSQGEYILGYSLIYSKEVFAAMALNRASSVRIEANDTRLEILRRRHPRSCLMAVLSDLLQEGNQGLERAAALGRLLDVRKQRFHLQQLSLKKLERKAHPCVKFSLANGRDEEAARLAASVGPFGGSSPHAATWLRECARVVATEHRRAPLDEREDPAMLIGRAQPERGEQSLSRAHFPDFTATHIRCGPMASPPQMPPSGKDFAFRKISTAAFQVAHILWRTDLFSMTALPDDRDLALADDFDDLDDSALLNDESKAASKGTASSASSDGYNSRPSLKYYQRLVRLFGRKIEALGRQTRCLAPVVSCTPFPHVITALAKFFATAAGQPAFLERNSTMGSYPDFLVSPTLGELGNSQQSRCRCYCSSSLKPDYNILARLAAPNSISSALQYGKQFDQLLSDSKSPSGFQVPTTPAATKAFLECTGSLAFQRDCLLRATDLTQKICVDCAQHIRELPANRDPWLQWIGSCVLEEVVRVVTQVRTVTKIKARNRVVTNALIHETAYALRSCGFTVDHIISNGEKHAYRLWGKPNCYSAKKSESAKMLLALTGVGSWGPAFSRSHVKGSFLSRLKALTIEMSSLIAESADSPKAKGGSLDVLRSILRSFDEGLAEKRSSHPGPAKSKTYTSDHAPENEAIRVLEDALGLRPTLSSSMVHDYSGWCNCKQQDVALLVAWLEDRCDEEYLIRICNHMSDATRLQSTLQVEQIVWACNHFFEQPMAQLSNDELLMCKLLSQQLTLKCLAEEAIRMACEITGGVAVNSQAFHVGNSTSSGPSSAIEDMLEQWLLDSSPVNIQASIEALHSLTLALHGGEQQPLSYEGLTDKLILGAALAVCSFVAERLERRNWLVQPSTADEIIQILRSKLYCEESQAKVPAQQLPTIGYSTCTSHLLRSSRIAQELQEVNRSLTLQLLTRLLHWTALQGVPVAPQSMEHFSSSLVPPPIYYWKAGISSTAYCLLMCLMQTMPIITTSPKFQIIKVPSGMEKLSQVSFIDCLNSEDDIAIRACRTFQALLNLSLRSDYLDKYAQTWAEWAYELQRVTRSPMLTTPNRSLSPTLTHQESVPQSSEAHPKRVRLESTSPTKSPSSPSHSSVKAHFARILGDRRPPSVSLLTAPALLARFQRALELGERKEPDQSSRAVTPAASQQQTLHSTPSGYHSSPINPSPSPISHSSVTDADPHSATDISTTYSIPASAPPLLESNPRDVQHETQSDANQTMSNFFEYLGQKFQENYSFSKGEVVQLQDAIRKYIADKHQQ